MHFIPSLRAVSLKQYLHRGNFIIIAGTTLALIGLTWGGIRFPWSSPRVLAPLVIGFALIATFFVYEHVVPAEPTTPLDLLRDRTSISG